MLQSTLEVLRSVLKSDATISTAERTAMLAQLRGGGKTQSVEFAAKLEARLVRRAEAARRLSCSVRTIDRLARTGVLRRRNLPGRVRGAGFLVADVEALIVVGLAVDQ